MFNNISMFSQQDIQSGEKHIVVICNLTKVKSIIRVDILSMLASAT